MREIEGHVCLRGFMTEGAFVFGRRFMTEVWFGEKF